MAGTTESTSTILREEATGTGAVAAAAVLVSTLLFVLGLTALFEVISITDPIVGLPAISILGLLLTVLGIGVIGFGIGSNLGLVVTDPRSSAGLVAAIAFSVIWFVVGGLIGSQTLGFGLVGWSLLAIGLGGAAFIVTVLPEEDIGSTLPAGLLSVLTGVAFVTGVIGPGWAWEPVGLRATFIAEFTIPVLTLFSSLLTGWAAAKAYGGFGARGRHLGAYVLVYLNALSIVSVLFVLVGFTLVKGLPGLLQGITFGAGTGPESTLNLFGISHTIVWPVSWPFVMNGVALLNDYNGVLPAIVGTFWLVVGAVIFAVPLGVGSAIFLTEYAERGRFTQVVEIATNGLWSTPSIVFGLFGFAFLVPRFGARKSLLSGMITLGFMLLPLVIITSREAMLAVPDEYRDASAALGVSKWQTIRSVVLPAALPGVVTGVILGVGRIAGETAPILLTMAGGTFVPGSQTVDVIGGFEFISSPPYITNPELLQATSALPYQLYALITAGVGLADNVSSPDNFKWAAALVLLMVVLSFYAIGIVTRYYFRQKLRQ